MHRIARSRRAPLLIALAIGGALGINGAGFAQQPSGNTAPPAAAPPAAPAPAATGARPSPSATTPARTDSADEAWAKLSYKEYIEKADVSGLGGFSFEKADTNHDGRLNQDEFRAAWSGYRTAAPSSGSQAPSANTTWPPGATSGSPSNSRSSSGSMGTTK